MIFLFVREDSDDEFTSPMKKQTTMNPSKSKVIMSGLVDKKVGFLIYKSRLMVLNDGDLPNLTYFDPNTNVKKVNQRFDNRVKLSSRIT